MINGKFRTDIVGDLDYEDLIADIYFEDQIVAVLTQESGFENLRISIHPPKDKEFWDFRLDEFEAVIHNAKERLWQLRKISEDS
jgi:hypothetical protein